jgi:uncharacterized protein YdeI (BOF family)
MQRMRHLSFALMIAAALTASAAADSRKVKLTGCVTPGDKSDTYVLTNVSSSDVVGTSGSTIGQPVYWLDSPGKLKAHVRQTVEITGRLDEDLKKTTVKEKDGKVEMKADGKKVVVPENSTAAAGMPSGSVDAPGYKVKVNSVKVVSDSCR